METIRINAYRFEVEFKGKTALFKGDCAWNGKLTLSDIDEESYEVFYNCATVRPNNFDIAIQELLRNIVSKLKNN